MLKYIEPWILDASNITKDITNPTSSLHINSSVSAFLYNDNKKFISATKGFGKTYLLKLKSVAIRNSKSGAIFIPKNELVDRIGSMSMPSLSHEVYNQYNSAEIHELLWRYTFILTIIRNSENLFEQIVTNRVLKYPKDLFYEHIDYPVMQDVYIALLRDYNLFKNMRTGDYMGQFETILRNSLETFYLFIDNVDEFYDSMGFIYNDDIWYSAQISLLRAVVKLTSQCSHIHIYGTIRKKALNKLEQDNDTLYAQYLDSIVNIHYSSSDLESIFVNNIKNENKEKIKNQAHLNYAKTTSDYMKAFIGFKEITNNFQIEQKKEELFSYIYRHTFGRPRDLMRMGKAISEIKVSDRDETTIRKVINANARKNGKQYINEIKKFTFIDFEKVYRSIEKNILKPEDTKRICCGYNDIENQKCNECEKTHLFCTLYTHGLIGIEALDINNHQCTIEFKTAGYQLSYHISHSLPESSRYFIHPCLSEIIESYRNDKDISEYSYDRDIIVGYDVKVECSIKVPDMIKIPNLDVEVSSKLVTFKEYDSYCDFTNKTPPYDEGWGRAQRPVVNISWEEAVAYSEWLSQKTKQRYRLPSELEWRQMCGGGESKWSFGDDNSQLKKYAWYKENSNGMTHTVATLKPNDLGIYDIYGNVWEWCNDSYDKDHQHRIVQGGAFDSEAYDTYTSVRGSADKDRCYNNIGFRLVREPKGFSLR